MRRYVPKKQVLTYYQELADLKNIVLIFKGNAIVKRAI